MKHLHGAYHKRCMLHICSRSILKSKLVKSKNIKTTFEKVLLNVSVTPSFKLNAERSTLNWLFICVLRPETIKCHDVFLLSPQMQFFISWISVVQMRLMLLVATCICLRVFVNVRRIPRIEYIAHLKKQEKSRKQNNDYYAIRLSEWTIT